VKYGSLGEDMGGSLSTSKLYYWLEIERALSVEVRILDGISQMAHTKRESQRDV
jgi:hypothetical protein